MPIGKCLCGRVSYQVEAALQSADHCHCSMCRRHHGAAFATYASISPGDFKWLSGHESVKVYEVESGAGWCFCTECGSSLAGTDQGEVTSITLGTVVGDVAIEPECHIFAASRAPWFTISDDLPQFAERQDSAEFAD